MKQKRKSNILTIVKKELRRFFGDKRMVMTILLPGLLIYAIYSLMGDTIMSELTQPQDTTYHIYAENLPASMQGESAESR